MVRRDRQYCQIRSSSCSVVRLLASSGSVPDDWTIAASVYVIECRDAMRASGRGNARLTRPTCAGTTDSTMSVTVRRVLAAFAMLGLGASTAASWVHYHLIQNPDYSS